MKKIFLFALLTIVVFSCDYKNNSKSSSIDNLKKKNDTLKSSDQFIVIEYFDNNKIESIETYDSLNRKSGYYAFFLENGMINKIGNNKNGKVDGVVKLYDINGHLGVVFQYENGKEISRKRYK